MTIIFETLSVPEEVLTGSILPALLTLDPDLLPAVDIGVDQLIIIAAIGGLDGGSRQERSGMVKVSQVTWILVSWQLRSRRILSP